MTSETWLSLHDGEGVIGIATIIKKERKKERHAGN